MKISNLICSIFLVGIMTLGICQSSEAVVYPNLNEQQPASEIEINQKLEHIHSEVQKIILEMKDAKDQRKGSIENMQKNLEKALRTPSKAQAYCVGKVAWALGEKCPE